jgi:hypothetical protein
MAPRFAAASASEGSTEKKARAPQKRVFHIFYKTNISDAGEPTIQIVKIMSDARKVVDFLDSDAFQGQGLKRYKHEVVSDAKGDTVSEGEAGASAE